MEVMNGQPFVRVIVLVIERDVLSRQGSLAHSKARASELQVAGHG